MYITFTASPGDIYPPQQTFSAFRTCIALLLIAAFSNSCFYYTVLYFDSDTTLCILRAIYHSSLLLIFCLYAAYLKILIGIPGKTGHIMNIFLYSLYIIFAVVDALSPVLGYSFYRDSSGAWHDNLYLKPFTIAYGIYMAFIFSCYFTIINAFQQVYSICS